MRVGSEDVVTAQKESASTRTFSIQSRVGNLTLQSKSIFGRAMVLTGSGFDAEITPKHLFSRAYQITGHVPNFEIACFAFWLTRMLQRRKNKDD